jgi:TusA-related sulfurtransferase
MHNEALQHRATSLEMAEMRVGQSLTVILARPKFMSTANARAAEFFATA